MTNHDHLVDKVIFSNIFYGDYDIQKLVLYNNCPVISNFKVMLVKEKSHSISIGSSLAVAITSPEASKGISYMEDTFQVLPSQVLHSVS